MSWWQQGLGDSILKSDHLHWQAEGWVNEVEQAVVRDLQADTRVERGGSIHLSTFMKLTADQWHHLIQQRGGERRGSALRIEAKMLTKDYWYLELNSQSLYTCPFPLCSWGNVTQPANSKMSNSVGSGDECGPNLSSMWSSADIGRPLLACSAYSTPQPLATAVVGQYLNQLSEVSPVCTHS